jgi:TPP-dependent pyruvate/acetoin dehydrogenase alpha subunit
MLQTVSEPRAGQIEAVPEAHLQAYRYMLRARLLDEKFAALYRTNKIHGGVFLGRGQEALSAALGVQLTKSDVFAPLIRDGAGRLAFGETILDAVRTYMGSSLGPMRGREGNVHRGKPQEGYLPMISHLGAMVSVVNGVLFARRMKGITGIVGAACLGDGATSTGAFHEALNQAAVEKLPLVLVRQSICVLHPDFAAIRLRDPGGPCRGLWDCGVFSGWHGPDRLLEDDEQRCRRGSRGKGPATGRSQTFASLRARRA